MALYLPYSFNQSQVVLGHYRATTGLQTTTGAVAANGIIFSAIFGGPNILAAILRITLDIEVTTNLTTAKPFDFNLFLFRGATGKAAGASSVVATLTNQQMRPNMQNTQWTQGNGEMRSLGGSLTGLTAASGKANSGSPIGTTVYTGLFNTSATGTAVLLTVGAALTGNRDLYVLQPGVSHPLTLLTNDGFEIQQITAPGAQALSYNIGVEWAEVLTL